jgi:RNA polymerase sigma factor (sigma-70 family)
LIRKFDSRTSGHTCYHQTYCPVNLQLSEEGKGLALTTEDSVVWKDLLGGDRRALAHIYSTYFDKLYNYGSKISRDPVIIEDCIQDLFIELWNRREGLNRQVKSIKHYLYVCLRRKIVNKLNQQHHTVEIDELASFDMELCHKSHYLNNQINTELRQKLTEVIDTLTPKQKEAIFLIYYDELSYPEVAAIMSLKIKTVYNLIHQAIVKLKGRKNTFWHMISFVF